MTVITIEVGDFRMLASVKVDEDALNIFCLDVKTGLCYKEQLPGNKFLPRIRKTNKRVYMPIAVVRWAITCTQPAEAKLSLADVYASEHESDSDIDETEQEIVQRTLLALKYYVGPEQTVLKWHWHLIPCTVDMVTNLSLNCIF
ncbi:hypothetical protein KR093_004168 [Drosophila rubida]|uniref:Uncharacterized protein n=1 Tax=Drosophila rubida TaxID=30044 RepID=A0AAD4PPV7_9MUSC|nr:hypothetical protein KR093_004168 [Drosophila rubida]